MPPRPRIRVRPPRKVMPLFFFPNPFRRLENILFLISFILILIVIIIAIFYNMFKSKDINEDNKDKIPTPDQKNL